MPLTPIPIEEFQGLDTNGNGGALDAVNVRVDDANRLRTRPGSARLENTVYAGASSFKGLIRAPGASGSTFQVSELGIRLFDSSYSLSDTAAKTGLTGSMVGVNQTVYFACETDNIQSWQFGTGPVDVATSPWCRYLAWLPQESRLIAAYAGFGALDGEQIVFSDPGTSATVWPPGNTLTLEPQNRAEDDITAAVTYRDLVFIFKTQSFYVFTGTSPTASGAAQLNYRAVDGDIGCTVAGGATAGPDGVYFIGEDGIYRTSGDPPELVSRPLQRWWDGFDNSLFSYTASQRNFVGIFSDSENVYVQNATSGLVFVYAVATQKWTVFDYPLTVGTMFPLGLRELLWCDDDGRLRKSADLYTFDEIDGGATSEITWSYQSDFSNLGGENEKVLREITVEGCGFVGLGVATDWDVSNVTTSPDITLGTYPQVALGRRRLAYRGRNFSIVLHSSPTEDANVTIERLVLNVRDSRAVR